MAEKRIPAAGVIERAVPDPESIAFDQKAEKRLLRKIDLYLIPFLALLYLLSFLDRSNIGNARLAGLEADLNMKGLDYNVALAIFFPFYVAIEVPSNIMMKATRPSIWIPTIMTAWGLMCVVMGLVKNYPGLLAARSALGIAEGGLFPGVTFYITMWYRRHECGMRMAIFFSAATAAGAFGGLLARGIMEIDGKANLAAWQWIFILEGVATFIVGCIAFFALYDYPETANFLTEKEKVEVERRLEADRSSLANEFEWKYFWDAIKDWKIWIHLRYLYAALFTLGYTNNKAQLMTVPPYIVACAFCIGGGILADRKRQRGIFMIFFCCVAILGFTMLAASADPKVKYAGTFFAATGIYPNIPQGVAWNGNNIGGSTKRGVGIAMQVMAGNMGGVISSFLYLKKDSPHYRSGHCALIGFSTMTLLLSAFMSIWLRRENKRRDAHYAKRPEEYTPQEKALEKDKGDHASFFRYTV